jgi:hypothetical protein
VIVIVEVDVLVVFDLNVNGVATFDVGVVVVGRFCGCRQFAR